MHDNNFTRDEQKVEFTHSYQFTGSSYIIYSFNRWSCTRIKIGNCHFYFKPNTVFFSPSLKYVWFESDFMWIRFEFVHVEWCKKSCDEYLRKKSIKLKWCLNVMWLNLELVTMNFVYCCFKIFIVQFCLGETCEQLDIRLAYLSISRW